MYLYMQCGAAYIEGCAVCSLIGGDLALGWGRQIISLTFPYIFRAKIPIDLFRQKFIFHKIFLMTILRPSFSHFILGTWNVLYLLLQCTPQRLPPTTKQRLR